MSDKTNEESVPTSNWVKTQEKITDILFKDGLRDEKKIEEMEKILFDAHFNGGWFRK